MSLKEAYGRAIGDARSKHVRKAIKELYQAGVTDCDGVGDIPKLKITIGPGVPRGRRRGRRRGARAASARAVNAVALSGDGNTLAVGTDGESSAATGINGNQADTSARSK